MAVATKSAVPPLLSTSEFDFDGIQACCARIQAACAKILADLERKREEGHQPVAAASPPMTTPSPTPTTPPDGAKTLHNPCCMVRRIMHGQVDASAILGGREESLQHAGSLPWPQDSLTWGCRGLPPWPPPQLEVELCRKEGGKGTKVAMVYGMTCAAAVLPRAETMLLIQVLTRWLSQAQAVSSLLIPGIQGVGSCMHPSIWFFLMRPGLPHVER